VDKPVLNVFRMMGLMGGERIEAASDSATTLDTVLASGVRAKPDIGALATRRASAASILVWNYHDDDIAVPPTPVAVHITGLPSSTRPLLQHYRIDDEHSNAFTIWKKMGAPQNPTAEQYAQLEPSGQLALLESPRWLRSVAGALDIQFQLPRQGVSLLEITW